MIEEYILICIVTTSHNNAVSLFIFYFLFDQNDRRYFLEQLSRLCCDFKKISLLCEKPDWIVDFIFSLRQLPVRFDSIRCSSANFLEKKRKNARTTKKRRERLHAPKWHIAVIYPRLVICRSATANGATTIKVAQFTIPSPAKRRFTCGRRRRRAQNEKLIA